MSNILYPNVYVDSIFDISLEKLKKLKIRALIIDLDNTLTEWNSNIIASEIEEWFEQIKDEGFKACILSNNGEERVVKVADKLGIPYIPKAAKPRRKSFYKAMALLESSAKETAVIGDQVFTDVLGGNRAGLFTILVVPINRKEFMGTKISRAMEYFVLRRFKNSKQDI
ncbi:Hydrolase, HAD subfamily IIIA [Candidatus Syntrophocurvum alkaliphilum]|uniref:Hydrolase, HAD subfamily IIIA n=1 Tax=Candidatus Syntrophocurvum alkaliphilum TaxID=2293317 RepID=A0A6I6D6S5_9FIRM|nr:YqeG family HAD IIIA-type phosphatase [Candidatus Syntrophocurvum alkaliphilum]QGT98926.1 Hydrolase, HAD subfamily IIIA [Candidatus Syntrophocurvum alkaliphilum]